MRIGWDPDDATSIIRLDPRTKLFIFVVSTAISLSSYQTVPLLVFGAVMCTVLALSGKQGLALKAIAALALTLYLRDVVQHSASSASAAAMVIGGLASMFLFVLPVFLSLLLLVETTRPSQLLSALAAMKLPATVVIPLAVCFRFIPTVGDEWMGIRKAMALRGINTDLASVARAPMRTTEYVLIPLLFSSISVMEELAAASIARGMDRDKARTSYFRVHLGWADYLVIAAFVLMGGYAVIFGRSG